MGKCFRTMGFYAVFGSSLALTALTVVYLVLWVDESRGPKAHPRYAADPSVTDLGSSTEPARLLSCSHLRDVFAVVFRRRANKMRLVLILLVVIMLLNTTLYGEHSGFSDKRAYLQGNATVQCQ